MNAPQQILAGIERLAMLREPFAANHISKLPKETKAQIEKRKADRSCMVWKCPECGNTHHKDAVHLDYVGHAALTDRLLDTDPEWLWEPVAFGPDGLPALDRNGGLWIRLTVLGVTRLGYGDADGKTGGNAVKEAIGDALRNAAMRFGAALDLWHKGDLHGEDAPESDHQQPDPPLQVQEMPDAEFSRLTALLQATGVQPGKLIKEYGVQNLRRLNQQQYANAVERLNAVLADKARQRSNTQGGTGGEFSDTDLEDSIPY